MHVLDSSSLASLIRLTALMLVFGVLSACDDGNSMAEAADANPSIADGASADALPAREVVTDTRTLEPGEIVEAILAGGPGDSAEIHLEAPVLELDWNIHGHADGSTQTIHEQLNQMTVDYTFAPTAEADWYLLLRNSGTETMDVQLRIGLYGEITWEWL